MLSLKKWMSKVSDQMNNVLTWISSPVVKNKKGYNLTDSTGFEYPGVYDNGSNIWIGAKQTAAQHHEGATYISSGHKDAAGNKSIYVSVPNADNDNASNYMVLHEGYAPTTPTISITSSVGTLSSYSIRKFGKVVQLTLQIQNSSATAAGANVYEGTISTVGFRPLIATTGAGYYGQRSFIGLISTAGKITVRNASSSQQAAITGSYSISMSFTYLIA